MAPTKKAAMLSRSRGIKKRRAHLNAIRPSSLKRAADSVPAHDVPLSPLSPSTSTHQPQEASAPPNPPTPQQLPHEATSASATKLKFFSEISQEEHHQSALPTTIVDLNEIAPLFDNVRCSLCRSKMSLHSTAQGGFAFKLLLKCDACDHSCPSVFTSKKSNGCFTVNRQTVAASLCNGMGFSGLFKFCETMNMPCISDKSYQFHVDFIHSKINTFKDLVLDEAISHVKREYIKECPAAQDNDALNITVSYDGSWQTRGHKSMNGVGCVIDSKTGLLIDYHTMSRYCKGCSQNSHLEGEGKKKWEESHKGKCTKNFDGTAGAMEVEGALVCWGRSLQGGKNLRYMSVISDGDCKTIKKLNELQPYGKDLEIKKLECVNHVSKRLGKALRDLVNDKKKQGITLGGKGEGRLTQTKIDKLQKYYTKAIRSNDNVVDMKKSVMATFYHCTSSDESPSHDDCPEGIDSWCFVNRSVARGEQPPSHKTKLGSYLCPKVAEHVKKVYDRMSEDSLLQRCVDGKTQNSNESLHSLLWNRCPKHIFVHKKRLDIALAISASEFNMGSSASRKLLEILDLEIGSNTFNFGSKRDGRRVYMGDYAMQQSHKTRRELQTAARKKEEEELRQREIAIEGDSLYVAGGDI